MDKENGDNPDLERIADEEGGKISDSRGLRVFLVALFSAAALYTAVSVRECYSQGQTLSYDRINYAIYYDKVQ